MGPKSYASQTQSSRKSSVTFMICIIISVSIVCILLAPSIFPSSSSTTTSKSNVQSLHSNRLIKYCSIDEFNGEEGKYLDTNNFEMKALVITLRHGDRSAIHSIPGKYTPSIDKIDKDSTSSSYLYDSNVSQYTSSVNQFVIVPMSENGHFDHDKIESVSFMDALDSPSLFGRSDMTLPQGQLTSTGFMQHIHLGDHLHNAYSSFISSVNSVKEVYIRSTNYHRTIQSVTALGLRFLPSIKNEKYPIKVFKDEKDEIMHGIGLKLSSHHVDSAGEKAVEGSCEKASNWAKQEKDYFKPSKHIIADLTHIFGDKIASRYFTDIVDSVLPSYCHKQSLPCGVSSQGKDCISENLLTEMMVDADRVFCDRYIGAHGGFNATRLSIYPFMNEIIENLKVSMDPLVSGEVSRKVTIFSGHDTVISPVLAALGVYKQFCTWPPLASRVVFELWQSKSPSLKFSSSTSSSGKYGAYFVRVLFNGEDIAMKIPACQNEYFRRKNRSGSSESYSPILCPFNVIETIVSEMISPYKTIQEACV